jgi:hypothetical protein
MEKMNVESITVDGKTYVPKDSVVSHDGPIKIIVLQRAWIYVGYFSRNGNDCKLEKAKNIRQWGTSKGLGELVDGPTSSTKLDFTGTVEFDYLTVVHSITVNQEKWASVLR